VDLRTPTEKKKPNKSNCLFQYAVPGTISYPLTSGGIPISRAAFRVFIQSLGKYETLYVHDSGENGRSGLVAACYLLEHFFGMDVDAQVALDMVNTSYKQQWELGDKPRARGCPHLSVQRNLVLDYMHAQPTI